MAFPIHPSRSAFDLMYSVLYDDYAAENAIKVIAELDKELPFPEPPAPTYKVTVAFQAATGGSLLGNTSEWVQAGHSPADIPFVTANRNYEFTHWSVDGVPVNPETYKVYKDTTFVAEFEFVGTYYDVVYEAGENGSLDGVLTQHIAEGERLTFPEPVPNAEYMFEGWYRGNTPVDIDTEVASGSYTYTARFKVIKQIFTIDIYDVKPRTTATGSNGITRHQYQVEEGDAVSLDMFIETTAGPTMKADGTYMATFNEVPTKDTWYQRIDNAESLTTSTGYCRKTFYAGRGGSLRVSNSTAYAYTAQARTNQATGITVPTPTPDSGWSFKGWINLATGATVSNPATGTTTTKYAAIFVEN